MIQIRAGMPSASYQQHLKDQNATLLFDLVRRRSPISRAELTKTSGLSAATVTVLVDELLQGGWLVELGAVGSTVRGRRPINLAVNAARGAVATLEILSDGSILSVYDICLHKLTQTRSRLPASTSAPIIAQLAALWLAEEQLLGIHILYPGLIDAMTERLSFSAVIRSWQQCCPTILPDSRAAFPDAYVMLSNNAAAVAYSAFLRDTEPPPLPLLVMTVRRALTRAQSCRADAVCRWRPGISRSTAMGRPVTAETAGVWKRSAPRPLCLPACGRLEFPSAIRISMALTRTRPRSRNLQRLLHLAMKRSQPACNAMAWIYAAQSCRWSTCWTCAPSGWAAFRIFWVSRSRSCCAAYSRRNFTS